MTTSTEQDWNDLEPLINDINNGTYRLKLTVSQYQQMLRVIRNIKHCGEKDIEKALQNRIDVLWAEIEVLENE